MTIGLGIFLIVIGAIIEWVIQVNVPYVDRYLLGWILIGAGVVIVLLSLVLGAVRGRSTTRTVTRDANGERLVSSEVQTHNETE